MQPYTPGSRIGWDYTTLRKISADTGARYSGYARLIELANHTLLAIYEQDGSVVVAKSYDQGNTWSGRSVVAPRQPHVNMAVPDVLQLRDGALLACYNPRPFHIDTSRHFAISTKKSYDWGNTWTDERLLYKAGHTFENGCWEPAAIQLPNGEIQLFFANEGVYTASNEQNISMLRSADGGLTWSATPEVVSFRKGSRDGMPVPVLLQNKSAVLVSIEDNGFKNFKPYVLSMPPGHADSVIDANNANRHYALADSIADTPSMPVLHICANCPTSELILSYQGTESRVNKMNFADMKVVIGSVAANDFDRKSVPFNLPSNKSGLWNSVAVLSDSTVVAITSTNAFADKKVEVWMIKGHLIPTLAAPKVHLQIDGQTNESAWQTLPAFVGNNPVAQLRSQVLYNDTFLYVIGKVLPTSADFTSHASVKEIQFSIDFFEKSSYEPYHFFLSPDNRLRITHSGAEQPGETIEHAVSRGPGSFAFEIAIPWIQFGGRRFKQSIGYNFGLTVTNNGAVTTDYISGNAGNDPKTWSTLHFLP